MTIRSRKDYVRIDRKPPGDTRHVRDPYAVLNSTFWPFPMRCLRIFVEQTDPRTPSMCRDRFVDGFHIHSALSETELDVFFDSKYMVKYTGRI